MSDQDVVSLQHVFDPSEINVMRCALEQALDALAFAYRGSDEPDMLTREELARAILRYASRGEVNPQRLTARALHELEPRPAYWVVTSTTREMV